MKNNWTGGQYSLFRVLFGTYLLIHFVHLIPWGAELFSNQGVLSDGTKSPLLYAFPNMFALIDSPPFVTGVLIAAAGLSLCFILGWRDRIASLLLFYVWASLFGRNPLISNPGLPYVGWMLLAHPFLPAAPFGSCGAFKRIDPDGGWRMPDGIFLVAWILMAAGYSYSGYTKLVSPSWVDGTAFLRVLENPLARPGWVHDLVLKLPDGFFLVATWGALGLELLYLPLAIFRRSRFWIWAAMLGMHFGLMTLIDFVDLSMGMVMLHLFTFDPAWMAPRKSEGMDTLYYDGSCGLCHRAVRFVMAEDRAGDRFQFAALGGELFQSHFSKEEADRFPDSLVIRTASGQTSTRSAAVLYMLSRLGGYWRILSWMGYWVPAFLRNWIYDGIAAIRYRIFARPRDACPILPKHLRGRFV